MISHVISNHATPWTTRTSGSNDPGARDLPTCVSKLLVVFFLLLLSSISFADTVSGRMQNDGDAGTPLKILVAMAASPYNNQSLELVIPQALDNYLRRLRTGDLITIQGQVNAFTHRLTVDSIDQVGLQELLGTWQSSRWEIFEFQNFSDLNVYVSTQSEQGPVSLSRTHQLKYMVTPQEEANRFSIFMSDNNEVRMGFIEVGDKKLTLTITDFKTGQVSDSISLSPIDLH